MKSGNHNFLEPSGPLQACNGTALPYSYYSPWGIPWHHSFTAYTCCEQEEFLNKWCYYQKITFHWQGLRLQYRHVDVHLSCFIITCFQQSHLCSHCHEDFQVSPAMGQYQKLKRLKSDPIPSQLNPIHTIRVLTYIVMEAVSTACMQEASSLNLSL